MFGLTLFRLMLILPIAFPVIALALRLDGAGYLGIATFVIAGPYFIFALWAWRRMGRFVSFRGAYVFLAQAPLIFAFPVSFLWFLGSLLMDTSFSDALHSMGQQLFALFAFGYLYSGVAALLAALAQASGAVSEYKSIE